MAGPTVYPELNAVLDEFVVGVREVLGENLCGAYLQGSFAVGGADEHSDVDFIVVTHGPLSEDDPEALQAVQERVYAMLSTWAQHLEGSYITCELLGRLDPACTPLLYFDNGSTQRAWDDHCNTAVVRWSLREHGIALVGPDPKELIDPISAADLRAEMTETLRKWEESLCERSLEWSRRFQGLLVLSVCRILNTLHCGRVGTKREAGDWALAALDPEWHELIRVALDDRPDPWVKVRQRADAELLGRSYAFLDYALNRERS
jgi:predicted nucleotidyltransferase